ncbi:hypothetical protein ABVT39_006536 [Epinephelus coioides]
MIMDMMSEIKALKSQNEEKEKRIASLESRVADLEQYTRMNDIIVSGLETRPWSYARAVAGADEGEPTEPDMGSVEQQVTAFFHSKGISIDSTDIEACHPLPRKNKSDKPAIIIRFTNRKHKNTLLIQGRKLRGTDVFVNEHLTKKSGDITRKARFLRKQKTTNYKVFIKLNESPEDAKFEAEYRRFALKRNGPGGFQEFYCLLQTIHRIPGVDVLLGYADIHGDLLPINNDDNFHKAVSSANPLLRIIITKKEDEPVVFATNSLQRRKKGLGLTGLRTTGSGSTHSKNKPGLMIGLPQNFRQISSIIDVDILPETHRRVRLHKHGTHKPLGFYIRDGVSVRVTPQGVEKVPGVFISRLVRGGLAESTGLLGVNDEILEVNGIDVAGKSLDQVTDMMVANSHNLIVTVKPANQRNNVVHRGSKTSMGNSGSVGSAGSTGSVLSHDSPSPASQSNPITASGVEGLLEAHQPGDGSVCVGEWRPGAPRAVDTGEGYVVDRDRPAVGVRSDGETTVPLRAVDAGDGCAVDRGQPAVAVRSDGETTVAIEKQYFSPQCVYTGAYCPVSVYCGNKEYDVGFPYALVLLHLSKVHV